MIRELVCILAALCWEPIYYWRKARFDAALARERRGTRVAEQHWIAAAVATILGGGGGLWKWLASRNRAAIATAEERKAVAHERTEQERLDQAQMQQLLERLSATERRATRLEERIDRQSGKIVALENDKLEMARRIDQLESEKRDQAARIAQLEREKAEQDQALDLLRGQLEQGDEHIAALTKLVEGLGHQPPPRPKSTASSQKKRNR